MTLTMITRFAMAAIVTIGASITPAMAASSAAEIRSALVGNTFKGSMGSDVYSSYFAENGEYQDAFGRGVYEITDKGVCYPGTEYGCYAAQIEGNELTWFQDGENVGSGVIEQGNTLK